MVTEIRSDHESDWAAMTKVAELLGVGTAETIRKWCRQAEVDAGQRSGLTTEESAELKRLKRENAELKRANAILKSASVSLRQCHRERCLTRVRSFLCCPGLPAPAGRLVACRPLCGSGQAALVPARPVA
jgi:transposase